MNIAEPGERSGPSIYFIFMLAFLNGVCMFAAQIALSLYALKLGAQALAVGALAAMFAVCPMLLAVSAGRLVDRYGSRWPTTFAGLSSTLGLLLPYFFPGLPALYVAGVMCGLSSIFYNLSTQNLVGLLSSKENRARNFTNYVLVASISNLLGPLLAGFSIEHLDHAATMGLLAALTLAPTSLLVLIGASLPRGTGSRAKSSGGGILAMLKDPTVQKLLVTGSLVNAGVNMYQVYMPVYAHASGVSAAATGIILSMNSAAAFVVRFSLPWLLKRFGEEQILAKSFFGCALALAAIPLLKGVPALAAISFLFGLGSGCGQPIVTMLMFTNSQDGRSGEALGLKFTTNQLTKLVAPLVFGSIATGFGLLPMYWIIATLMTFGGWVSRPKKS
jgi:MFS family permease